MGKRLEEFYKQLRSEVAQMEYDYLKEHNADEDRLAAALNRIEMLPGDYMDIMVKKDE